MKILMIFTSKFHYTGITKVVMNYYEQLIKNESVLIDFVVPNEIDDKLKNSINLKKSDIFVLPMKMRRHRPIKYIRELKKIIKKGKYDVVHVHGSSAIMAVDLLAAKLGGAKTRIVHSHNTVTEHKTIHYILKPIFSILYTDAFACGEAAGKWLFGNKKFTIINNAQLIDQFIFNENNRNIYRKKNHIDDKIVIGHVGAFNNQKNHEFLIQVFNEIYKQNKNYYLILIGEGPLFSEIVKKVHDLNLEENVLFVGKSLEVNKWLNAMDLMVLPSKYEGLPNVLIEWQISGLPCIVSSCVTEKAKVTDLIDFHDLDVTEWVNSILEKDLCVEKRKSSIYKKQIESSGYDIKVESNKLFNIYKKIVCKNQDGE